MWGDYNTIRERLGSAVKDLLTERGQMPTPTLSAGHYLAWQGAKIGPFIRLMGVLQKDPAKREAYIAEYTSLLNEYLVDNIVKHEYVLTRAIKV
jgi:hypothetical protein